MKKIWLFFLFSSFMATACNGQQPTNRAHCQNAKFDKTVANWLSFTVPTVSPNDVKKMPNVLLLDARERAEYNVSHLPNAIFIGYNNFDKKTLDSIPKDKPLVVYCSIGYRSEKIGEKLQKMGFTKVYNLYGSIFEWINEGNQIVDNQGNTTKKVHTFNKSWSKWVDESKAEKVW
ncbi:MAG: rhodanese-like domain-containing protein [Saprospiraceae bacterium]|nr:rhodanese-like domain-containing protein [Saprospiraceae bacterium]